MQAIILSGIQGTGKSTFCRERFFATHIRINLDMLKTRNREDIILHACLAAQQPFVIDNTNPTAAGRIRYVQLAKAAGFSAELYYFASNIEEALRRNTGRPNAVPELAIRGTFAKLQVPSVAERFDQMHYVRTTDDGNFVVEEWRNEV